MGSHCLFSCLCCKIHQNLLGNLLLVNLQIFDAIYTSQVASILNLSNFLYCPVSYFWEHKKPKYKNEFLLEFHGGRKVSTIQEFSSDDLMDVKDPPFSSHIFWIKSKIINLIDWLIDWCCYLCLSRLRYTILLLQAMYQV